SVGSYQLERHLHTGAFGQVWVGRHAFLTGHCAVKVVPDDMLGHVEVDGISSYQRLADAHTGLIPVRDFGHVPGKCYFYSMPLADDVKGKALLREVGEYEPMTLDCCCKIHRPLPIDRLLGAALSLLPSLHALHEAGFVHRDVKPANIIL